MSLSLGMAIMRGSARRAAWTAAWIVVPALAAASALFAQLAPVYQVVVDLDPVAIDVAVTDRQGRAVRDLSPGDFVVQEDGQPQELRDVTPIGMPYSILLLV